MKNKVVLPICPYCKQKINYIDPFRTLLGYIVPDYINSKCNNCGNNVQISACVITKFAARKIKEGELK